MPGLQHCKPVLETALADLHYHPRREHDQTRTLGGSSTWTVMGMAETGDPQVLSPLCILGFVQKTREGWTGSWIPRQ